MQIANSVKFSFIFSLSFTALLIINLYAQSGTALFKKDAYVQADSNVSLIGQWHTDDPCISVAVQGNYAYVGSYYGKVRIFDVGNPASPVLTGQINMKWSMNSIAVSGNYAYVGDNADSLHILDISDPKNPIEVKGYYFGGTSTTSMKIIDTCLYISNLSGLYIIDISNPKDPKTIYNNSGWDYAWGVDADSSFTYLADGSGGLMIFNTSNTDSIKMVGQIGENQSMGYAYGVGLYSHYACLVSDAGLYIIDVSDPSHPNQIGFHSLPKIGNFTINGVTAVETAVRNHYLYLAAGPGGLLIFDLSSPASPKEIGYYVTNSIEDDIALSNNYMFVSYDYEMNDTVNGGGYILKDNLLTDVKGNGGRTYSPDNFYLYQNYPNPFNPSTTISYRIAEEEKVVLKVYNLLGKEVAMLVNRDEEPGKYSVQFNAAGLASGVYLYRLQSGNYNFTKKLIFLK